MSQSTSADDLYKDLSDLNKQLKSARDLVDGWTRGGGSIPSFPDMRIGRGDFVVPPIETMYLERNTTQGVANQWDDVQFTSIVWRTPGMPLNYDTTNFRFTYSLGGTKALVMLFAGNIGFGLTNSSGMYGIMISSRAGGARFIAQKKAATGAQTVLPFMFTERYDGTTGSAESSWASSGNNQFRMQVFQNAAPSTDIGFARLGVILLGRIT